MRIDFNEVRFYVVGSAVLKQKRRKVLPMQIYETLNIGNLPEPEDVKGRRRWFRDLHSSGRIEKALPMMLEVHSMVSPVDLKEVLDRWQMIIRAEVIGDFLDLHFGPGRWEELAKLN